MFLSVLLLLCSLSALSYTKKQSKKYNILGFLFSLVRAVVGPRSSIRKSWALNKAILQLWLENFKKNIKIVW